VIADRLEQAGRYRGLDPRLDRGLEALLRLAADPLAVDGRQELEGEDLYASLSTYATGEPAEKPFEAHRRYIDIQTVLGGREVLYWTPLEGLVAHRAYSQSEDIALYEDPPAGATALTLEPGSFVVLFPQDAHKPGCHAGGAGRGERVRKLVLKVRL